MALTERGHGTIAGHGAEFVPAHREGNDTDPSLPVTMSFAMSLEDVAAVLWLVAMGGQPLDELDAEDARMCVLDTVLNGGASAVDEARWTMLDATPGTVEHWAARVATRFAAELFGTPAPRTPTRRLEVAR